MISSLKKENKAELADIVSDLMPRGNPDFIGVLHYRPIYDLVQETGTKAMRALLFLMVKNFCESINVVRNMNEDQMIETASMLLDECQDYRLEDYVVMFTLAKRGRLVKIYDHVDIEVVGQIRNEYEMQRFNAKEAHYEQQWKALPAPAVPAHKMLNPDPDHEKKLSENFSKLAGRMKELKNTLQAEREADEAGERERIQAKQQEWFEKMEQWAKQNNLPAEQPIINLNQYKKEGK